MRRRDFLKFSASSALAITNRRATFLDSLSITPIPEADTFYVSSDGSDDNPGTLDLPFASLQRAREIIRTSKNRSAPIKVLVRDGTYYLNGPLTFDPEDSGTEEAPITYAAYPGERVTLSGGRPISCTWTPHKNGIMMTPVPRGLDFTQLFINGKRKIRARYPNFDASQPGKSGYLLAAGAVAPGISNPYAGADEDMTFSTQAPRGIRFDPASFTKKKWANPQEAEIHIYQAAYWGNLQWKIKGIDFTDNVIWFGEGGRTDRSQMELQSCLFE